ncbi:uncharacterized protein [Magallana gigas]|uniref:uncharacterized protein n=1 Tax=Magallana gigas TaxID=29159 RepID=UPI003341E207
MRNFIFVLAFFHLAFAELSSVDIEKVLQRREYGEACGECDRVPDFCGGKGLCLNTHNPRLTHCQCERGSFGRHCEFNDDCLGHNPSCFFFSRMHGPHTINEHSGAFSVETAKDGVFIGRTNPVMIFKPRRLILTYIMAANVHDYEPQIVFWKPHDFDTMEIMFRGCRDRADGVCAFENEAECSRLSEQDRQDRWCTEKKFVHYAYYPHDYANKKRVVCIDVSPQGERRFMEFGVRTKCNNPRGCNLHGTGSTSIKFSLKLELGTCQYFEH